MSNPDISFYVTGGTLRQDALSYMERRADHELLEALLRGEFCYVLTARQMGKSSLMVRTAASLRAEGVTVAILDLTAVGQNLTAEQWYEGLLGTIGQQLDLEDELDAFWLAHPTVGPLQRFMRAVREVVLPSVADDGLGPQCGHPTTDGGNREPDVSSPPSLTDHPPSAVRGRSSVVLFLDEIDVVRNLPFSTDEFFAAIRECYNRRTEDPAFRQLTFCLLGVATPSDLIRDTRTTPFNIGRRIDLSDFTEAEAAPLAIGLEVGELATGGRPEQEARALLKRILYWTGGHPYLTQRLCQAVAATPAGDDRPGPQSGRPTTDHRRIRAVGDPWSMVHGPLSTVDRLVHDLFLSHRAQERDDNLLFVRERLLRSEADLAALLDRYRRICAGKRVPDDDTDPLCGVLRLSGVTRVRDGRIRLRNRIYERVFDRAWVTTHMPGAELRRQKVAYRRGLARATAVAIVIVAVTGALGMGAVYQARLARDRLARVHVGNGMRLAEEGDLFGGLPWLVEALRLEQGDRARVEMHRMRIASVLGHCPRLVQFWFQDAPVNDAQFSPDGGRVVIASADGTARVWDTVTGLPVTPPLRHGDSVAIPVQVWDKNTRFTVTPPLRQRSAVVRASFSPDGRRLVTASWDGTARLWDATTGEVVAPPLRHAGPLVDAEFSGDGQWVVTASTDRTARIWDAVSGRPAGPPLSHPHPLICASFSPDGRRILTACASPGGDWKGEARVWDSVTSRPITSGFGGPGIVVSAAFSPDGRRVATAGVEMAQLWDAASGAPITPRVNQVGWLSHTSFSPDSRRFVTTGNDGAARVWDASTGQPIAVLQHAGRVNEAHFSADGRRMVTASDDGTARVWDADTGQPAGPPLPHSSSVLRASLSPDGRFILTAGADQTVRLWDAVTPKPAVLMLEQRPVLVAKFRSDGRAVLTCGDLPNDSQARVWDAVTGRPLTPPLRHTQPVRSGAFSPDGRWVVTGSWDGTAQVWDTATGEPVAPPLRHKGRVHDVSFSPEGRRVITASGDRTARIWDTATGRPLTPPLQHDDEVASGAFSPDGRWVVTGSWDGTARVWDAATGRPVSPSLRHDGAVYRASFSPDGIRVVTASWDGTARLWIAATGKPVAQSLHHSAPLTDASFSPDGRGVVSASVDNAARVWDAASGTPITPPLQHRGAVVHARFSPDSRLVATASEDHTARLWETATGLPVGLPLLHEHWVNDMAFSPDGRRFVTGTYEVSRGARIWDLSHDDRPVEDLLRLARLLSGRQVDATIGSVPADPAELRQDWETLRNRYPRQFSASPVDVVAWRERDVEAALREAEASERAEKWAAAISHLSKAIELAPGEAALRSRRSNDYTRLQQWKRAMADRAKVIELQPDVAQNRYPMALVQLTIGDSRGYGKTCAEALARFGATQDPGKANSVAWLCGYAPNSGVSQAVRLAERAVAAGPKSASYVNTLGTVLYRAGRFEEAIRRLQKSIAMQRQGGGPYDWFILAMAHQRLGHPGEARQWLEQAERWMKERRSTDAELSLFRREAEAMIRPRQN